MPHGITQCYLPPGRGDIPTLAPAEAGTRLSDPVGTQGWVDLEGKVENWTILRWHIYSGICTKNYWNQTTTCTIKVIIEGWVVYFFATQCRYAKTYNVGNNETSHQQCCTVNEMTRYQTSVCNCNTFAAGLFHNMNAGFYVQSIQPAGQITQNVHAWQVIHLWDLDSNEHCSQRVHNNLT